MSISTASMTAILGSIFAGSAVIKSRSNTVNVGHRAYKFRLGRPVRVFEFEWAKRWHGVPIPKFTPWHGIPVLKRVHGPDGKAPIKRYEAGFVWQCFGVHRLEPMQVEECFTDDTEAITADRTDGEVSTGRFRLTYNVNWEGLHIALMSGTDHPSQVRSYFLNVVSNVLRETKIDIERDELNDRIANACRTNDNLMRYGVEVLVVTSELSRNWVSQAGDRLGKDLVAVAERAFASSAAKQGSPERLLGSTNGHSANGNGHATANGNGHHA